MQVRWTEDELLQVIKLYCEISFGQIHSRNKRIVDIAIKLKRSPSSIAMKMANLASLDPTLMQKGLPNSSQLDKIVWNKFFSNIDFYLVDDIEMGGFNSLPQPAYENENGLFGEDVNINTTQRSGQSAFRTMILASYENQCALTGISDQRLLNASHISPWATDRIRRLDPRNGICLNVLHDRAFDRGLISFDDEYKILFANKADSRSADVLRATIVSHRLKSPTRFLPDVELLRAHRARHDFKM